MAERRQATVEQLIRTYAALLLLMVPTLAITFFDWGVVNPVVNLGVAVLQAALIVGNFMGLRWASRWSGSRPSADPSFCLSCSCSRSPTS
jgi:caa(3)-type oxidase subunit IV